jgi:putative transposase
VLNLDSWIVGEVVGDSGKEAFRREFLTGLTDRGLARVHLVIIDAHAGLIKAVRCCFQGAAWQRCRVHAMGNLLSAANGRHRQVIAALARTIFVQADTAAATAKLRSVVEQLHPFAPGVADRREAMKADLLAYARSHLNTGPRSSRTTRPNASTSNSSDAPTSSGCSPTRPP